jgi:hypothetical protein
MLRRLLLLAFVALAALGLRSAGYEQAVVAEVHATAEADDCCPCDDDGAPDDGCCKSASCACFGASIVVPPRLGAPDPRLSVSPDVRHALGAEQRARDRSSAPPTPPPIG